MPPIDPIRRFPSRPPSAYLNPPVVPARSYPDQFAAHVYYVPPPPPRPAAPYVPPSLFAAAGLAQEKAQAKAQAKVQAKAPVYSDTSSPGPSDAAVNAFKQTNTYKQAVLDVFRHQSPHQQQAILVGALHNTVSPEAKMIRDYVASSKAAPDWTTAGIHGAGLATISPTVKLSGFEKFLSNAVMDVATMPSGTLQGLWSLGKQGVEAGGALATGNIAGAESHASNVAHQIIDPFVQLATHPLKTIEQHPVNTLLMLSGAKALLGKGIGAAGRAAGSDWASTAREPLNIGTISGRPAPIVEARSYSRDAINQAVQRSREHYLTARGRDPNVAQPALRPTPRWIQQSFNIGAEAKLNRQADEMASVRQTLGRAERARVLNEARKAAPSKPARGAVAHILQGVIRTPETAAMDAAKEIERLKAARTHQRSLPGVLNRKQVRDLETAMNTPGALEEAFRSAAPIRSTINAQDAYMLQHGLLSASQIEAKLFPYAQAHMGATFDHRIGRLVNADHPEGIPTEAILEHLKNDGVPDPAYVGHYADKGASWRFYKRYNLTRGSLGAKHRTGEAFRIGGYDHSYEGLLGQLASRAEAATKASLHDKVVARMGIKKSPELVAQQVRDTFAQARAQIRKTPGRKNQIIAAARKEAADLRTGLYTPDEARRAAYAAMHDDNGNPDPTALELTPMTAFPAKAPPLIHDLQDPRELPHLPDFELRALANAIDDARVRTDKTRNVVLAPKVATDRFTKQFERASGGIGQDVGRLTQQFRKTVLPYSAHWMAQIQTEAALRSALAGVLSPHYLASGRRLMARLQETEEGRAALAETVGSMFWTQHSQFGIHHDPNPLVRGAKRFPVSAGIIRAHNLYANGVSHAMTMLERNFRAMGLGKLAHNEVQEFSKAWQGGVALQSRLIDQLAHRMETNPALVAKLGRQIDNMFGQYSKFSPTVRSAIQSYTPFLSWYLTASKYVLWQLPVHHPVASALLASLRQTVNQDVVDGKQMPLSPFAMQSFGTLSPFGIFTPEDATPGAAVKEAAAKGASMVLPQLMGPAYAFAGLNPYGDQPLRGPQGVAKPQGRQAREAALESAIEAFAPLAGKIRQAEEGGRPGYGTSTLWNPQPKPGTSSWQAIVNRTLNPFYGFERALHSQPKQSTSAVSSGIGSTSFGSSGFGSSKIP